MSELLTMFKNTIGDDPTATDKDVYYTNLLRQAIALLSSEDISDDALDSDLGMFATTFLAVELMNGKDVVNSLTLQHLRINLAAHTKGDRYDNG